MLRIPYSVRVPRGNSDGISSFLSELGTTELFTDIPRNRRTRNCRDAEFSLSEQKKKRVPRFREHTISKMNSITILKKPTHSVLYISYSINERMIFMIDKKALMILIEKSINFSAFFLIDGPGYFMNDSDYTFDSYQIVNVRIALLERVALLYSWNLGTLKRFQNFWTVFNPSIHTSMNGGIESYNSEHLKCTKMVTIFRFMQFLHQNWEGTTELGTEHGLCPPEVSRNTEQRQFQNSKTSGTRNCVV